jgi:hypothetical protein
VLAVQFVVLADEHAYLNESSLALVLLYLVSSALVFMLTLVTVLLRLTHAPSEAPTGSGDMKMKHINVYANSVDAPRIELTDNPLGDSIQWHAAVQPASSEVIGDLDAATLKKQMDEMRRAAEQQNSQMVEMRRAVEQQNSQMDEMRRAVEQQNSQMDEMSRAAEQQRRETESRNQQMDEMRRQLQDFASRLENI